MPFPDERLAMAGEQGKKRRRYLVRQGRAGGESSTSVESSSRFSQDMQLPVPSVAGTTTRGKRKNQTAMQHGSEKCSHDSSGDGRSRENESSSAADDTVAEIDTPSEKPDLEAYCRGSWWDVEIKKKRGDKYLVHYLHFSDQENEWLHLSHLRMRCRTSTIYDCDKIFVGKDVCVMARHPHSDEELPAWFDARVIHIERRPHNPKSCKCTFKIALYRIPPILLRDCSKRTILPVSQVPVDWKKLSIMREARSMSFKEVVAAALLSVKNTPRIWAKDGARWYSSFDYSGASGDRSSSFESRAAGGGTRSSRGRHEEYAPEAPEELKPFKSFLEEEDYIENLGTSSSDESDGDLVILSSVPGSKAQPVDYGPKAQPIDSGPRAQPIDSGPKAQPIDSGPKAQYIDLDADDVAICDAHDDAGFGYECLGRYSIDDECDEKATSPERPKDVLETQDPTKSLESLGDPGEDLDEVVLSDFHPVEPVEQIPLKPISVTSDVSSPVCVVGTIAVPVPPAEPATSSGDLGGDDFAQLLEESIAGCEASSPLESAEPSESSDKDDFADYLEKSIVNNCGPKRSVTENRGATSGAKRRRSNLEWTRRLGFKPPIPPNFRDIEKSRPNFSFSQRREQVYPKKVVKEQARVSANQGSLKIALARSPAKGGKNLGRSENIGVKNAEIMLDPDSPPVADILARSKDASKSGLPTQPSLLKEKRPKKVGNAAVPKKVVQEITYAELFKSVKPAQCIIPSENGPAEESSLMPSWNPFMESVGPDSLREVEKDSFADVWKSMRFALESGNKGDEEEGEMMEESAELDDRCENSGWSECLDHTVEFDQEVGEVCGVCGFVLLGIQDIWARDNPKRIAAAKEGDDGNDEVENYGSDYGCAVWDFEESDKLKQQNNIEEGSNIELIPGLAKDMQRHQKQGFHFLWRNLAGQDANGNACFPQVEPGGCVLSHAPGTGKTFLIISFLQSYMKKYPDCRPIIVAPKIMLKPWEKEFRKWNVDIPVHNFSQASEQGKFLFQKHQEAGVVQYVGLKKNINVHREAMLWEWLKSPSVLVISYPMFNRMTLNPDNRLLTMKEILLTKPSIVVLDEGHNARNPLSQVQRQLMAIKTPLRILLSGTLFQNNFEELYTCLNLARSGFMQTFAKLAGLKFNMQQETASPQSDVESGRYTGEWKEKSARAVEAQAKKLFIEEIGNKIDKGQLANSTPEYAQGLELLRRLTTPFVHHYAGGVLRVLPPLRDFTIVLQPAALQEKMIKRLAERMQEKTMLEREGLLSFVCIHPSLLSQHNVGKTFTNLLPAEEMAQAASDDPAIGVKTRFVMNLIEKLRHRGGQEEKMLIFCLNLNPLSLLESMLKTKFGWVREKEVMHIDGKVTPEERQSIIERFNDPQGKIRVLLLSTKACGEGITLTGASRVIFMDVLWNPAVLRQAIHRAFRLGQTKVVHVYRLVVTDCFEEEKYKRMVLKDLKSQTIFCASDENHEKVDKSNGEVCGPPQHDFWEVKMQSSKDPLLNELERQDAALDQPAFKHVFRHGGLFDVEYDGDPEGKGANATEWLRNQTSDIPDSYDMDGEIGGDTPESYDIDGDIEGGTYDIDTDDSSADGDNDDF